MPPSEKQGHQIGGNFRPLAPRGPGNSSRLRCSAAGGDGIYFLLAKFPQRFMPFSGNGFTDFWRKRGIVIQMAGQMVSKDF